MGSSSQGTLPPKDKNNVSFFFAFPGPSTGPTKEKDSRIEGARVWVRNNKQMEKRPPKIETEGTKNLL